MLVAPANAVASNLRVGYRDRSASVTTGPFGPHGGVNSSDGRRVSKLGFVMGVHVVPEPAVRATASESESLGRSGSNSLDPERNPSRARELNGPRCVGASNEPKP